MSIVSTRQEAQPKPKEWKYSRHCCIFQLRSFFSNLCLTVLLSALWTLCFEMPFMTLDRTLLSRRSMKSKLTSKPNQGKLFGSTDSSKEIYRPTEERSTSIAPICDEGFDRNSSEDSVYDSAGNVSYPQGIYESGSSQDLKSTKDDMCPFIFVIGGPESNDSWPKVRNVHQNNGFDGDSDDVSQSKMEGGMDRGYVSILNEDSSRNDGSIESEKMNDS